MATKFQKTGGWDSLEQALDDAKFRKKLAQHVRRANKINGLVVQRKIRQDIKAKKYAPNAPLTIALKGSKTPLVDSGGLFQAITMEVVGDAVFVGVKRTNGLYDVALALHEGVTIPVTEPMRRLFWTLWKASVGSIDPATLTGRAKELWEQMPGGWKPISKDTKAIVIPERPFIRQAFADAGLKAKIAENWEAALKAALTP